MVRRYLCARAVQKGTTPITSTTPVGEAKSGPEIVAMPGRGLPVILNTVSFCVTTIKTMGQQTVGGGLRSRERPGKLSRRARANRLKRRHKLRRRVSFCSFLYWAVALWIRPISDSNESAAKRCYTFVLAPHLFSCINGCNAEQEKNRPPRHANGFLPYFFFATSPDLRIIETPRQPPRIRIQNS
ncbi:hypothetical protein T492DRAFT_75896 [Pavlovales sp. CCMP2436]|nr:hypothetical protein T492DRAFT_75896 [Pavlovales sp. CCMP2436]